MIRFLYRLLPIEIIAREYLFFGEEVGSAVRCSAYDNLDSLLDGWSLWEGVYSKRGFRTLTVDDFICGNYDSLLCQKRVKGEEPVYHSKNFLEKKDFYASKYGLF